MTVVRYDLTRHHYKSVYLYLLYRRYGLKQQKGISSPLGCTVAHKEHVFYEVSVVHHPQSAIQFL